MAYLRRAGLISGPITPMDQVPFIHEHPSQPYVAALALQKQ